MSIFEYKLPIDKDILKYHLDMDQDKVRLFFKIGKSLFACYLLQIDSSNHWEIADLSRVPFVDDFDLDRIKGLPEYQYMPEDFYIPSNLNVESIIIKTDHDSMSPLNKIILEYKAKTPAVYYTPFYRSKSFLRLWIKDKPDDVTIFIQEPVYKGRDGAILSMIETEISGSDYECKLSGTTFRIVAKQKGVNEDGFAMPSIDIFTLDEKYVFHQVCFNTKILDHKVHFRGASPFGFSASIDYGTNFGYGENFDGEGYGVTFSTPIVEAHRIEINGNAFYPVKENESLEKIEGEIYCDGKTYSGKGFITVLSGLNIPNPKGFILSEF